MDQTLPPNSEILNAELSRLYAKRLMLNELIRNLERYAELESEMPAAILGGKSGSLMLPLLCERQ